MRIASIDIGTNTVLLLVAEVEAGGTIVPIANEQRLPRLGRDVDHRQRISIGAYDRIAWIVQEYTNLALQYRADRIVACATSAVRDASNREEFLAYIKSATGIDVEVLTGEEEAELSYRGTVNGFPHLTRTAVVLDIGGGSTEMSYPLPGSHNGNSRLVHYSMQIGAVRLTERYLKHSPPAPTEIDSAREFIIEELSPVRNPGFAQYQLVGVAGTVTTLACLDQHLTDFDVERVSGYRLGFERVAEWFGRLSSMASTEIRSLSRATEGREDILTAGVLILNVVMRNFGFQDVLVSERGLRHGLALREADRLRGSSTPSSSADR
jgi:exopolyphosphatase/guanosine-5'-triphosphate,3'-diphosphate pyrophosphatase